MFSDINKVAEIKIEDNKKKRNRCRKFVTRKAFSKTEGKVLAFSVLSKAS